MNTKLEVTKTTIGGLVAYHYGERPVPEPPPEPIGWHNDPRVIAAIARGGIGLDKLAAPANACPVCGGEGVVYTGAPEDIDPMLCHVCRPPVFDGPTSTPHGGTGPKGHGLADYENPVFDGPSPREAMDKRLREVTEAAIAASERKPRSWFRRLFVSRI